MSTDLTLLHTTKEVAYEAIKQYGGQQLQFCTKELQDDASTVVFAVSKYGKAIRWASDRLKQTHSLQRLAFESIRHHWRA